MPQSALVDRTDLVRIEPLTSRYLTAAVSLLYQSYYEDPLFMEIFKADRSGYPKRLQNAISEEVKGFWQNEETMVGLFVGEQLLGIACVVSPNFGLSVGRFWQWRLKMLLSAGFVSAKQMVEKEEKIRAAMVHEHYHMLAFLATHSNHRNHGLGNRLIQAVDDLVEADPSSAGMGVYVTLDEYYEYFQGFGYRFVSDISVGNVDGKLMFRRSPRLELES